jgi:hypothetical protein
MKITKHKHWSAEAEYGLRDTLRDCGDLLEQQIESGIAELWEIGGHSWMITRAEYWPDRKPELVICCYQGRDLATIGEQIVDSAKANGFGSIRYHTPHKGLNRLLKKFDFEFLETVYMRIL